MSDPNDLQARLEFIDPTHENAVHETARVLVELLDDPHPGLLTWCVMRNVAAEKLYDALDARFGPADPLDAAPRNRVDAIVAALVPFPPAAHAAFTGTSAQLLAKAARGVLIAFARAFISGAQPEAQAYAIGPAVSRWQHVIRKSVRNV